MHFVKEGSHLCTQVHSFSCFPSFKLLFLPRLSWMELVLAFMQVGRTWAPGHPDEDVVSTYEKKDYKLCALQKSASFILFFLFFIFLSFLFLFPFFFLFFSFLFFSFFFSFLFFSFLFFSFLFFSFLFFSFLFFSFLFSFSSFFFSFLFLFFFFSSVIRVPLSPDEEAHRGWDPYRSFVIKLSF